MADKTTASNENRPHHEFCPSLTPWLEKWIWTNFSMTVKIDFGQPEDKRVETEQARFFSPGVSCASKLSNSAFSL